MIKFLCFIKIAKLKVYFEKNLKQMLKLTTVENVITSDKKRRQIKAKGLLQRQKYLLILDLLKLTKAVPEHLGEKVDSFPHCTLNFNYMKKIAT